MKIFLHFEKIDIREIIAWGDQEIMVISNGCKYIIFSMDRKIPVWQFKNREAGNKKPRNSLESGVSVTVPAALSKLPDRLFPKINL
jgi:hypothetical protein